MKNFQNGGVAGVQNLTSSFDVVSSYLSMYAKKSKPATNPIAYDYLAPVEGKIECVYHGNGTKQVFIKQQDTKGNWVNKLRSTVYVYSQVELKDYVREGESIQKVQGDYCIREVVNRRGVEYAQRYLAMKVYSIFKNETYVDLKHFETIVAGMTFMLCTKGNGLFHTGNFYTLQEYYNGESREGAKFEPTLIGVDEVPLYRTDVFSTMFMEEVASGIRRSILLSGYDSLTNPIVRMAFGLKLNMGSTVPGYIEGRGA